LHNQKAKISAKDACGVLARVHSEKIAVLGGSTTRAIKDALVNLMTRPNWQNDFHENTIVYDTL
jgi:hypothetical protein